MFIFDAKSFKFIGPNGSLAVPSNDDLSCKLAMLVEGECTSSPINAANKFGLSRQRYFQLRKIFKEKGSLGLIKFNPGPKSNYRRTNELVCQIIRHRFLDPDASSDVVAQKLRQTGFKISKRSVDRVFSDFGLQKKTLLVSPRSNSKKR